MIVVEGPDGGGKTTLINMLREDLDLPIAPRVVSQSAEAMVDIKQWVVDNVRAGWQNTLFDRHRLISEPIYGPALRGEIDEEFADYGWLHEATSRFYSLRPIVVYCLPPFELVWRTVMADEDNRIFHTAAGGVAFRNIYWGYFNKALNERIARVQTTFKYDYTQPDAGLAYSNLLQRLKNRIADERMKR